MLVLQSAAVGVKYGLIHLKMFGSLIHLKMFGKKLHAINTGLLSVLTTE